MKRLTMCLAAGAAALSIAAAGSMHAELAGLRAESEAAWNDIAAIHAARQQGASVALAGAPAGLDSSQLRQAGMRLAASRAMPADGAMLDDPQAINAWLQRQGELTGALFMLAQAPQLASMRERLLHDETALASARARYRQASASYNAQASGPLAALLRFQPLPPSL